MNVSTDINSQFPVMNAQGVGFRSFNDPLANAWRKDLIGASLSETLFNYLLNVYHS